MHGVISMTLAWISSPLRRAHPACSVQVTYFLPPRLSQYRRTHVISTQCLRESVKVGASLPGPSREGLCRVALGSSEASPRVVANDHVRPPAWHCWGKWQRLASASGAWSESLQKLPVICAVLVRACMKMKRAGSLQPGRSCLCSAHGGSSPAAGREAGSLRALWDGSVPPHLQGSWGMRGGTALATSPGLGSKRCS